MALPRWLKPENAEHRLFLADGTLHLVPLESSSPHLTQHEGVQHVRNAEVDTQAPSGMVAAVKARLSCYPAQAREHRHTMRCSLPLPAAHVFRHAPGLVAKAVRSLCDRDQDGMKACRKMANFPPETSVMTMVVFPRCPPPP